MTARSFAVALMLATSTTAFAQTAGTQQPPPKPETKPEEQPVYEEQVVVTASKVAIASATAG